MNEATFFLSLKKDRRGAFETDEGGPEKQLIFFFALIGSIVASSDI